MKEIRYSFDTDEKIQTTIKNMQETDVTEDGLLSDSKKTINDSDKASEDFDAIKNVGNDITEKNNKELEFDDNKENTDNYQPKRKAAKTVSNNNSKKRKKLKKILSTAAIVIGLAVSVAASPVFAVDEIVMNDLHYFSKEDICSQIGLNTGDNGIFFNKLRAEKILEANPYISSVKMSFKFPNTMIVSVSENKICGYINYLGSYLYIDRSGCVIDIKSETTESLPIIEGLKFSSFTINNKIPVENKDAFQAALAVSNAMCKYGVLDDAVSINVSDTQNLFAYIDNIKVLLGDNSRMEEKIKTMAEAVKEIQEGDRGTLDLTDLSKPIIFKYTT